MFVALPKIMVSTPKMHIATSKKSALELNKQPIIIGDEIEGIALNWFSSVRYNSNRGTLLVDFHPDLKPYLLQLQGYFTQYENKNIQRFKCVHSLRFYEFLKQKQNLEREKSSTLNLRLRRSVQCFVFQIVNTKRIKI